MCVIRQADIQVIPLIPFPFLRLDSFRLSLALNILRKKKVLIFNSKNLSDPIDLKAYELKRNYLNLRL